MKKYRIQEIADYIVGSAQDKLPVICAVLNSGCTRKEFQKIKKKKVIKEAIKEHSFIMSAKYLQAQVEHAEKSRYGINNELFVRLLDTQINEDLFGLNKKKEEKTEITINVRD